MAERSDQVLARYRSLPKDPAPVTLSAGFLRMVEHVAGMPCNRSGQDKSWVLRLEEADRRYFADLKRKPGT